MKLFNAILIISLSISPLQKCNNSVSHLYYSIGHREQEEALRITKTIKFTENEKMLLMQAAGKRVIFYESKLKNDFYGLFLATLWAHVSFYMFGYSSPENPRSWKSYLIEGSSFCSALYLLYRLVSSDPAGLKEKLDKARYIHETISDIKTV